MTKTLLVYIAIAEYISNTMSSDAFNKCKVDGDHHQGEDIVSMSDEGGVSLAVLMAKMNEMETRLQNEIDG